LVRFYKVKNKKKYKWLYNHYMEYNWCHVFDKLMLFSYTQYHQIKVLLTYNLQKYQ
jgi:hypothetical protein